MNIRNLIRKEVRKVMDATQGRKCVKDYGDPNLSQQAEWYIDELKDDLDAVEESIEGWDRLWKKSRKNYKDFDKKIKLMLKRKPDLKYDTHFKKLQKELKKYQKEEKKLLEYKGRGKGEGGIHEIKQLISEGKKNQRKVDKLQDKLDEVKEEMEDDYISGERWHKLKEKIPAIESELRKYNDEFDKAYHDYPTISRQFLEEVHEGENVKEEHEVEEMEKNIKQEYNFLIKKHKLKLAPLR